MAGSLSRPMMSRNVSRPVRVSVGFHQGSADSTSGWRIAVCACAAISTASAAAWHELRGIPRELRLQALLRRFVELRAQAREPLCDVKVDAHVGRRSGRGVRVKGLRVLAIDADHAVV